MIKLTVKPEPFDEIPEDQKVPVLKKSLGGYKLITRTQKLYRIYLNDGYMIRVFSSSDKKCRFILCDENYKCLVNISLPTFCCAVLISKSACKYLCCDNPKNNKFELGTTLLLQKERLVG